MPVYQAKHFMVISVDSIINQTLKDWELIIVDDGSTDGSAALAYAYAAQDKRIVVIHKENGGVSAARQTGLEKARGDYIIHVDPDDWIEPNMLQALYNTALTEQADVVICDFFITHKNGTSILSKQRPSSLHPRKVLREIFIHLHGSCWNKLVRRECLSRYNVLFPKGLNYCEDVILWVQLLQHEDIRIAYEPHAYYHYVQHANSITHAYTRDTYNMRILFLHELERYLPQTEYEYEKRRASYSVFIEGFHGGIFSRKEAICQLWKHRRAAFWEPRSTRELATNVCILLGIFSTVRVMTRFLRKIFRKPRVTPPSLS